MSNSLSTRRAARVARLISIIMAAVISSMFNALSTLPLVSLAGSVRKSRGLRLNPFPLPMPAPLTLNYRHSIEVVLSLGMELWSR